MIWVRTDLMLRFVEESKPSVEVGKRDRDVRCPERGDDFEPGADEAGEGVNSGGPRSAREGRKQDRRWPRRPRRSRRRGRSAPSSGTGRRNPAPGYGRSRGYRRRPGRGPRRTQPRNRPRTQQAPPNPKQPPTVKRRPFASPWSSTAPKPPPSMSPTGTRTAAAALSATSPWLDVSVIRGGCRAQNAGSAPTISVDATAHNIGRASGSGATGWARTCRYRAGSPSLPPVAELHGIASFLPAEQARSHTESCIVRR
jgi:hypothetical protein